MVRAILSVNSASLSQDFEQAALKAFSSPWVCSGLDSAARARTRGTESQGCLFPLQACPSDFQKPGLEGLEIHKH